MPAHQYRLLAAFEELFTDGPYRHRNSTLGDHVAMHLYEDLHAVGRSNKYIRGVEAREQVLNVQNRRTGIKARRGDGSFGELVPGAKFIVDPGYVVARGPIATVEIGIEVKILAKAMIKQIDRVGNDLRGQVEQFKRGTGNPICVGIVGVNFADEYVSFEKDRSFPTTGKSDFPHPIQEAEKAITRLELAAVPAYDEFLFLRFKATNGEPYPFEWLDRQKLLLDYGAILARVSREYDARF